MPRRLHGEGLPLAVLVLVYVCARARGAVIARLTMHARRVAFAERLYDCWLFWAWIGLMFMSEDRRIEICDRRCRYAHELAAGADTETIDTGLDLPRPVWIALSFVALLSEIPAWIRHIIDRMRGK